MRKWPVLIEPRAKRELEQFARWNAARSKVVADRFWFETAQVLDLLSQFPFSAPASPAGRRRIHLRVFPIGFDYRVKDEAVEIIAVTHDKQRPQTN